MYFKFIKLIFLKIMFFILLTFYYNTYYLRFLIIIEYIVIITLLYIIILELNSWLFLIYLIFTVRELVLSLSLVKSNYKHNESNILIYLFIYI